MTYMPVQVNLQILNSGSHFSEDKFNMAILYCVLIVIFGGMTIFTNKKYREDQARFEEEDSPL